MIWNNQNSRGLPPFTGAIIREGLKNWILQVLNRGECCAIVGPSNTGKSLLLRMLIDTTARSNSRGSSDSNPLMIFIDCLDCAGESELAFYELILRRIHQTMVQSDFPQEVINELEVLREDLLNASTSVEIRAHFAISMHTIGCLPGLNMVLLLDEFDDVFRTQSPWPFRQLRAIRDTLGNRLCYLTATSRYLKDIRNDTETYEFRELFQMYTEVLKPLNPSDQKTLLDYLMETNSLILDRTVQDLILSISGGHPGFLTRITLSVQREGLANELSLKLKNASVEKGQEEICRRLLRYEPLREECRRLWTELESQEQQSLMRLSEDQSATINPSNIDRLAAKGLIIFDSQPTPRIFSPLFDVFLKQEAAYFQHRTPQGVQCNPITGQIWVDEREITLHLSDMQRKLIRFLYSQNGATCTHQDIITEVWGAGEGVSPGAVYELVKRLRMKIEKDWKKPSYLLTVPGEGYRLEKPF